MLEKELPQKHEELDFILPSPILQRAVGGCYTFIAPVDVLLVWVRKLSRLIDR